MRRALIRIRLATNSPHPAPTPHRLLGVVLAGLALLLAFLGTSAGVAASAEEAARGNWGISARVVSVTDDPSDGEMEIEIYLVDLRQDEGRPPRPLAALIVPPGLQPVPETGTGLGVTGRPPVSLSGGETLLQFDSAGWPADEPARVLTLTVRLSFAPAGLDTGARLVLLGGNATGPFSCWGEVPRQRDAWDIDQDGDLGERWCAFLLGVPMIQPIAAPETRLAEQAPLEGTPAFASYGNESGTMTEDLSTLIAMNRIAPAAPADFGDAPLRYGVASHALLKGVALGLIVDADSRSSPDTRASGDDNTHYDDEDGIFWGSDGIGPSGRVENEVTVVVLNRAADRVRLDGWLDVDGDGRFEATEKIVDGRLFGRRTNPQAARLTFPLPADARCGPTIARFRLSQVEAAAAGSFGPGEVEDIPYTIACLADLTLEAVPSAEPIGRDETLHWTISVTNKGPSAAETVSLRSEIPPGSGYFDHTPGSPAWRCRSAEEIRASAELACDLPVLAAGETMTVDLALIVPRTYSMAAIPVIMQAATETSEADLSQNFIRRELAVQKRWVVATEGRRQDFAFMHVAFHEDFIRNSQFVEQDFRLDRPVPNHIQVPISVAFGYHAGSRPWLTVPSCDAAPGDPTCNSNNRIEGQVVVESYTILKVLAPDGSAIYAPEKTEQVYLNRVADAHLSRCAGNGSCVGFDLFRVEKGGMAPYAWHAPRDYFYLNFVTKGGEPTVCPADIDPARCLIVADARPGPYRLEVRVELNFVFDDRRLGDEPLIIRPAAFIVSAELQILAPFTEPER